MRDYEVTIVLQPQLEDNARSALIERISEMLTPGAAENEKPERDIWGMRRLAYPIRNFSEGYYVLFHAAIDPARIREIERNLQYIEDVLRYLVVRKDA